MGTFLRGTNVKRYKWGEKVDLQIARTWYVIDSTFMCGESELRCTADPTCLVALWCRRVSPNIVTGLVAAEGRGEVAAAVSGLGTAALPDSRLLGCCCCCGCDCWPSPLAPAPLGEATPKPPAVGVAGVVAAVLDPVESRLCIL